MARVKIVSGILVLLVIGSSLDLYADRKKESKKEERCEKREKHRGKNPHHEYYQHHQHCRSEVVAVRKGPKSSMSRHYRPKWHPRHQFERRWVYFPRYNMYWDNYREVYVYSHYGRWVAYPEPPRIAINADLTSERFFELGVELDTRNDVFSLNARHRVVFSF